MPARRLPRWKQLESAGVSSEDRIKSENSECALDAVGGPARGREDSTSEFHRSGARGGTGERLRERRRRSSCHKGAGNGSVTDAMEEQASEQRLIPVAWEAPGMEGRALGHIAPPGALKPRAQWRSLSMDSLRPRRPGLALRRAQGARGRNDPGPQFENGPISVSLAPRGDLSYPGLRRILGRYPRPFRFGRSPCSRCER